MIRRGIWGALLVGGLVSASLASADVASFLAPRLGFVSVEVVSTTLSDEDSERVRSHVQHALTANSDLSRCLDDVRIRRFRRRGGRTLGARAMGSLSAWLTFERSQSPTLRLRTRGPIPAAARRCVRSFMRRVRLWNTPSGTIVLRARFEIYRPTVNNLRMRQR